MGKIPWREQRQCCHGVKHRRGSHELSLATALSLGACSWVSPCLKLWADPCTLRPLLHCALKRGCGHLQCFNARGDLRDRPPLGCPGCLPAVLRRPLAQPRGPPPWRACSSRRSGLPHAHPAPHPRAPRPGHPLARPAVGPWLDAPHRSLLLVARAGKLAEVAVGRSPVEGGRSLAVVARNLVEVHQTRTHAAVEAAGWGLGHARQRVAQGQVRPAASSAAAGAVAAPAAVAAGWLTSAVGRPAAPPSRLCPCGPLPRGHCVGAKRGT